MENKSEQSTEEVLARNKQDALRLAREVWRVVCEPEFLKIDPSIRMKTVNDKVPEFCKAYPSVIRWMVRDLQYSEKAFSDYLDMLTRPHADPEPGKGYLEYIRKQAEYSRILYKHSVSHWNPKTAAAIFKREYDAMVKTYNEMKKEEEDIKSEFDDEKVIHKDEKIKEIVSFIKNVKKQEEQQPTNAEVAEKVHRIGEIVSYRMKQADELAKGNLESVPVEVRGTETPMVTQEPDLPTPEELERREARMAAEQKARDEDAAAYELRQKNRAQSFLPENPKPKSKSKNNRRKKK
jgi:hypothetical protein